MSESGVLETTVIKNDFQQKTIKLALIRCGIKCDHSGFGFLTCAICEAIENPKLLNSLKALFTIVAQKCGAKDFFRVEANIHNAIAHTYKTRGFDYINQIFGMDVLKSGHKPTTAEFIKLLVEYYSLGLYKNQPFFA